MKPPCGFKCETCQAHRLHGFRIHRDADGNIVRYRYKMSIVMLSQTVQ